MMCQSSAPNSAMDTPINDALGNPEDTEKSLQRIIPNGVIWRGGEQVTPTVCQVSAPGTQKEAEAQHESCISNIY